MDNLLEIMQKLVDEDVEVMKTVVKEDIKPLIKYRVDLERKEFNKRYNELLKLEEEV